MSKYLWSTTANSNANADPSVNWSEGMAPSAVNNSARAQMAASAKERDDVSGKTDTGGSADAYTFTSAQGFTSLLDGIKITFRCSATNTGASTINVDSLGTKPLRAFSGEALPAGYLVEGSIYTATYDSGDDEWLLHSPPSPEGLAVVPVGTVLPYAGSTAPTGYLLAYGQAISRTTYSDLFALIGTTYGAGDTTSTFNLPDLRGRVVAGKDNMGGTSANRLTNQSGGLNGDVLGATGGSETHTLTIAQMPAHTHSYTRPHTTNNIGGSGGSPNTTTTADTSSVGGGNPHNNVQPTIILNYIIKT